MKQEQEPVDIELVSEMPVEAKIVKQSVGSFGKPLTPEQMIREENNKIKNYEDRIERSMVKVKDLRFMIKKAKERIKLYEKAISLQ